LETIVYRIFRKTGLLFEFTEHVINPFVLDGLKAARFNRLSNFRLQGMGAFEHLF
jgi:hypothetical protein